MKSSSSRKHKNRATTAFQSGKRASCSNSYTLHYQVLEPRQLLATLFVDGAGGAGTGGNDANNGLTLGTAFASIQAAANIAQPGDTIQIRGGEYRETVSLPRSGTSTNPITFEAYNNEDVAISGADFVTGWTRHSGNIWRATAAWNAGNNRDNNTLFVNGALQQEARQGADNDFFDIADWGILPRGRLSNNANSFRVDDLSGFADDYWNGAKISFHTHDWIVETRTITDFSSNGTITLDSPVGIVNQKQTNGYFIYDSLRALDKAGEWFKDNGNTLYYQAEAGQNPNNLQIEFKRRAFAFDVRGRDHINIQGIEFRGASIQTNSNTDYNVYQDNVFHGYDRGLYGRFFVNGDHNVLRDNEFSDTWTSFVTIGGTRNEVVNNYIHDIGYIPTTRAISASGARELLVSHNTVSNFARSFMDGYPVLSEISYNIFENGGRLSWDTGVFDSDGRNGNSSNSVFHHNILRNTSTRGIFEGFYGHNNNATIHHNLIHDFNPNGARTVFRAVGTDFRQVFHNTIISGVDAAPVGVLETDSTVQARYNNNLQISTERVESVGVDLRGNHNYSTSDFVDFAARDFRLAAGSAAIDSGIVIPGINDNVTDGAPDAGAFEAGQIAWTAGHDFVNQPNPVFNGVALPGTNLYGNGQFLQGIGDWTITSGTPNSRDRNSWNLSSSGASLTGNFRTQSVEFTPGEAISRTFTGLTPNTTYTIGATARVANRIYNGNQFNGSSGSIGTGIHRNEGYATGLSANDWVRFDNIDFGDLGQFDQIDLLHIRNPGAAFPTVDGVSVQFRLDSPTGTLLGELTDLASGNIVDRWRADRTGFATPTSGVHSIYVSVSGSNAQNLALGSVRLLNSSPQTADLLTVSSRSLGGETVVAQIGNEDWYVGYDEISFTTGPSATSAEIRFENNGRLNAYLDRFYLLAGNTTRGGSPRGILSTATAERSVTPTTSDSADLVIDGLNSTFELTGDHAESWIQVDLDEVAAIHSIELTPLNSFPQLLSNFRVSVFNGNPQTGGVELWSQDYLTDGTSLLVGDSQVIQADTYGRDGSTQLGDVSGQFVLVQLLGPNNAGSNLLAIADIDIQLFDESNLAVTDSVSSQSSTEGAQTASNAIDGDPGTLSATDPSSTNSWWQTRLTNASSIGQIKLVNHDNSNFEELSNFTVSVWDEDPASGGTKLWEKAYFSAGSVSRGGELVIDGSETGDNGTLRLASVFTGRVVRVQLNGTNNAGNGRLSLADVRVAPTSAAKPLTNLAQRGVATQSADFYGNTATYEQIGYASTAIDGVVEPRRNFTTTPNQSGSWWQVELQQASDLEQIVLVNRTDAANRLNNFTVSVWSGDPDNGGTQLWSRGYGYSGSAPTYSTSAIGPGGALIIDGSATSGGVRLDDVQDARFVRVQLGGSNLLSLVEVQVWGETPASSAGTVELAASSYSVGDQVDFTVRDSNAASSINVVATSSSGNSLPLTLTGANGVYTGSFTLVDGSPVGGELQVASGETFDVSYIDANDGTGQSISVIDSASVTNSLTFAATGLSIPISNSQTAVSTINVVETGILQFIEVEVDIEHSWNEDVVATLISPNGEEIQLVGGVGGSSNDFTNTVFAVDASTSITAGSAPFTGRFQPQESFAPLLGQSITGDWTLRIEDTFAADDGMLLSWSLSFGVQPDTVTVDTSQTEFYYDLGAANSVLFNGNADPYVVLPHSYSGDISFTGGNPQSFDRGAATGVNSINRDGVLVSGSTTFNHKLADGVWSVLVNIGDRDFARDNISVSAEGQTIFTDVDRAVSSFSPNLVFEVPVSDGQLNLTFDDLGGVNNDISITRIVLSRVGDLPVPASVEGRQVFYNNSYHDGNDATANADDDAAIATDKVALLPGQAATFSNYTSYEKGLNGVIIDINNLEDAAALSATDFILATGNGDLLSDFSPLSTAPVVSVRTGEGVGGSDRVTLTLPDGLVTGTWLSVTVLANENTGLAQDDLFYFGNAVGDIGNNTDFAHVTSSDESAVRSNHRNFTNRAGVGDSYDFNRDGLVTAVDESIARNNTTNFTNVVKMIVAPNGGAQQLTTAAFQFVQPTPLAVTAQAPNDLATALTVAPLESPSVSSLDVALSTPDTSLVQGADEEVQSLVQATASTQNAEVETLFELNMPAVYSELSEGNVGSQQIVAGPMQTFNLVEQLSPDELELVTVELQRSNELPVLSPVPLNFLTAASATNTTGLSELDGTSENLLLETLLAADGETSEILFLSSSYSIEENGVANETDYQPIEENLTEEGIEGSDLYFQSYNLDNTFVI